MQQAASRALQEGLRNYDKKRGWRGPIGNVLKITSTSTRSLFHPSWHRNIHTGDIAVGLVEDVGSAEATVKVGGYRGILGGQGNCMDKCKICRSILKPGVSLFKILSSISQENYIHHSRSTPDSGKRPIIILANSTGEIKAMVGGYDFESSEFNRATQALRQVGSTSNRSSTQLRSMKE